jgi:hypothetical protein
MDQGSAQSIAKSYSKDLPRTAPSPQFEEPRCIGGDGKIVHRTHAGQSLSTQFREVDLVLPVRPLVAEATWTLQPLRLDCNESMTALVALDAADELRATWACHHSRMRIDHLACATLRTAKGKFLISRRLSVAGFYPVDAHSRGPMLSSFWSGGTYFCRSIRRLRRG